MYGLLAHLVVAIPHATQTQDVALDIYQNKTNYVPASDVCRVDYATVQPHAQQSAQHYGQKHITNNGKQT